MDGSGHRSRLRRRLFEGGPDALLDHELVEYLLALALPRRDTKDLAKRLIAEFGGFGGLLSADGEAIMRLGGVSEGTAAAIKIAQAAALRLLESQVKERPVLGSWQALLDYLHADMAHEPVNVGLKLAQAYPEIRRHWHTLIQACYDDATCDIAVW